MPGNTVFSVCSMSYSGRKEAPHCEMQCASSMAMRSIPIFCNAPIIRSVISRSGLRYNSRTSPAATRFQIATLSSREAAELMVSAATPASFSAATWSCMRATRGETMIESPPFTSAGT